MQKSGSQNDPDDTIIIRKNRSDKPLKGWLVLLDPKGLAKKSFELIQPTLSIGRDRCNDIVLEDPAVSRIHCYIKITANEVLIIEENPVNGVFINEYPKSRSILENNMMIRLGETIFMVKLL